MKVILLEDVSKIGRKYEVKDVSSGYANNFLIPKRLAEIATPSKIKGVETLKAQQEEDSKVQEELLAKNIESINGAKVTIEAKSNEKGHLFQGIHVEELANALKEQSHIDVLPSMIDLEHPLKNTGEFEITVKAKDKEGKFKLFINPSK